jgi:hypothetical protein
MCQLVILTIAALYRAHAPSELFLAMFLGVSDCCLFRMPSGVYRVRSGGVSMVRGLLMMPRLVMLGRFPMMAGGVCVMF